jgi:hypothetical protein
MSTLESWIAETSAALNLPPESFDAPLRDELLDVTRDVAHGVARVAGPLTTYLIGVAVGGGMPRDDAIRAVVDLAANHAGDDTPAE